MVRSHRVALVTDLDNTLYDFATYYEAGIAALVAELERHIPIDRPSATAELRQIFTRHGSIEYPFAVEELSETVPLPRPARRELARACMRAFWEAGSAAIRPYPTVCSTLTHLHRQRVPVIGHTDAPIHEALRRLRHLGLDRHLTGIVAQQWFRRRPRSSRAVQLSEVPGWTRPPRRLDPLWRIPVSDRKPNALVYRRIADDLDIEPRHMTVIGDSVARDLLPAVELGCTVVWARYGRRGAVHGIMKSIVPHVLPEVGAEASGSSAIPSVDTFEEVLQFMATQQVITSAGGTA